MPNGANDPNPYNDTTTYIFNIVITARRLLSCRDFRTSSFLFPDGVTVTMMVDNMDTGERS